MCDDLRHSILDRGRQEKTPDDFRLLLCTVQIAPDIGHHLVPAGGAASADRIGFDVVVQELTGIQIGAARPTRVGCEAESSGFTFWRFSKCSFNNHDYDGMDIMNNLSLAHRHLFQLGFLVPLGLAPSLVAPTATPGSEGLRLRNGWFAQGDRVIWGCAQHNGWWGGYRGGQGFWTTYKVRTSITRNSPGEVGPCLTEDLAELTDNMRRYGYPGFEHNYGLWYDRRRDAHDTTPRKDPQAVAPFLEQPWARSSSGAAWDGLPKYDLTRYNPWYFDRLKEFAGHCDRKGTILFHNFYMQHALLETQAHYVDFPWRPANCLQTTDMPDRIPAANVFYDVTHPVRRELHREYIRHCLDVLRDFTNVVHLPSQEYTGPFDFVQFWMDTIAEWEQETGVTVHIGLGTTKDVLDRILTDPLRAEKVSVIDLRYWWYQADGSLFAPVGGREVPGRYAAGFEIADRSSPRQIYRQVKEYRARFPDKGIIHAINATRQQTWAFLMGGGSMLIRRMEYPNSSRTEPWKPPATYIAPEDSAVIQTTYDFIRNRLATPLPEMTPQELVVSNPDDVWCLAKTNQTYLVYLMQRGRFRLNLSGASGAFRARWFDPRTGALTDTNGGTVRGGGFIDFEAPNGDDWALLLTREGNP